MDLTPSLSSIHEDDIHFSEWENGTEPTGMLLGRTGVHNADTDGNYGYIPRNCPCYPRDGEETGLNHTTTKFDMINYNIYMRILETTVMANRVCPVLGFSDLYDAYSGTCTGMENKTPHPAQVAFTELYLRPDDGKWERINYACPDGNVFCAFDDFYACFRGVQRTSDIGCECRRHFCRQSTFRLLLGVELPLRRAVRMRGENSGAANRTRAEPSSRRARADNTGTEEGMTSSTRAKKPNEYYCANWGHGHKRQPGCYTGVKYEDEKQCTCVPSDGSASDDGYVPNYAGVTLPESTDAARSSGTDERRRLPPPRRAEPAQQAINKRLLTLVLFFHGILLPICVAIVPGAEAQA
ncbi:unnamed protein product, partial [Mesorhabditis spiculigera]